MASKGTNPEVGRRIDDARHFQALDVGSELEDRLFDGIPQRDRRRRTTVTAAIELEFDDSVAEIDQFDVATVRTEQGSHLFERLLHAGRQVDRMQIVQHQERSHPLVGRQAVNEFAHSIRRGAVRRRAI